MFPKVVAAILSVAATYVALLPVTAFAHEQTDMARKATVAEAQNCSTRRFGPVHHPLPKRRITVCEVSEKNAQSAAKREKREKELAAKSK